MIRPWKLILLTNLLALPVFSQRPAPPSPATAKAADEISPKSELVLKTITERYEKLRNWKAKFNHGNTSATLGTTKYSEGDFVFAYPNRFRFSLNGPSEISDFISDGTQAWYVKFPKGRKSAALVQVSPDVKKLELDKYLILLRGLPAGADGKARLLKEFKVTSRVDDKLLTLVLEPKRSDSLAKVELRFQQTQDAPDSALIADSLGGESTVKIHDVAHLKKIDPDEFKPKYPKDSQIVKAGD